MALALLSLVFLWGNPGPDGLNPAVGRPCLHLPVYLTQGLRASVCIIILEPKGLPLFTFQPIRYVIHEPLFFFLLWLSLPVSGPSIPCNTHLLGLLRTGVFNSSPHQALVEAAGWAKLWPIKPPALSFQAGLLGTLL